ncbi:hypothetical protein FN846DRAFT_776233 [Sphaerosporella brunnea]|uniref:Adenylate cyclase n=1 Tax=Sphaerosporella brunnea TaxID=1250544 RepID=A0A5J5F154_9PEZI|nr:hypothetical protein FN846DRAFT_776233 [Sphaerosporella brunnea]
MNFSSDHRRELAVLQNPPFVMRQNPPSASPSPVNAQTPTLNSNIFDTPEPYALSPLPMRPGTAPSSGAAGSQDSYFPPDETRRPSVASVVTNASSTGSKSSIGRSFYQKIFGETSGESPGSSESSLPPNVTPRSQYGFTRPVTPTISRPRTPVPPSEVVPFLYQDPEVARLRVFDIRRIGDAPVHEAPFFERRHDSEDATASTSSHHAHRLHFRGRPKHRDKNLDKDLPAKPGKEGILGDYRKGLKLHLDGTASSHSSQTQLIRSSSPTPSIASSLSNNVPRSPGDPGSKGKSFAIWNRIIKKDKAKEHSEKDSRLPKLRSKASEPLLNSPGISPIVLSSKRGSGGHNEYVNSRAMDYASVEQIAAVKSSKGQDGRKDGKKDQLSGRKGRVGKAGQEEEQDFRIDTDFSNLDEFVKRQTSPPDPNSSWLDNTEAQPDNTTWEPPESWGLPSQPQAAEEPVDVEENNESGPEDAQYCIRVFRADSTFATLSCKLQASVTEVLGLLGRKSFLQDNLDNYQIVMRKNGLLRILGPNERPLKIQKRLLEQAGYTEEDHLDEIGREDHGYLVRFTFMMARTNKYSLDQDPGLNKVQKFSHVDLQGRNLLTIPITLYHKAPEIISLNLSKNLSLYLPKDFIQQCVNLRKIEFTGNEAERLPGSIASASRLTYLDISNNRLEDLSHASLEEHMALVALKMSNNRLQTLPNTFGQFRSLRSLHISSNRLKAFPPFICDLVTLVELDISFNRITSFPLEIGQLSALERLTAANNRLAGSLPQTFSNLSSLKELDLRFNYELQNIDVVAELPRLEALVMSHNRVTGFQKGFHKLRALHLNSNPVTRFSLTTVLPTLKFLNLSNAKIAAINDSLFDKLPNLEKLILDNNHIVSFPPQIAKLRRLEHLSCANNELATIPKELGQLQELKVLDLHYNNIKSLPGEIWQMVSLMSLNLSSNIIKEFPKPVAGPAPGTTFSEIASMKSEAIPENPGEEEASERPDTGDRRPSQQSGGLLGVGNSPGQNGTKGSIVSIYGQGGRKASVISKAGSDTGTIPPAAIMRKDSAASGKMANTFVYSLKYLHLADNRLSDECFEELSLLVELRVLNLSFNDLYDIPPRALSRMSLLNELYLSGNELTSLPAEDLESIQHLKVLHLNCNKFQTLPAELGKIRKLLVLDVGNNALKYNISNWPYDWNWNWNLELKYLNLSGNKRLEIKPGRNDTNASREKSITDFSQLTKLRVLGLMDVTLMIPNIPDQTEDRRVRLSGSMIRTMSYGMADSLGRGDHLSLVDMVVPDFRGSRDEWLVGLFDGQALSTGGSKISKFLYEHIEFHLKEELNKLRPEETPVTALRRTFLNLNKELASCAMQPMDDKGATRHPSTGGGAILGPIDMQSGGVATVIYNAGNTLFVANVGDATAVLTKTDATFRILTKKHDPGTDSELKRIHDAGGWVSRTGKLNDVLDTSRAFGYFHLMPAVTAAPDIQEIPLEGHEELLILASREMWEYLSPQAAVDIARTEKADLMRAAHKLRDIAIACGAQNKIMVMVLGVGDMKKPKRGVLRASSMSMGQNFADEEYPTVKVVRKRGKEDSGYGRVGDEVRAPDGDLALVFTDIKNSTLLWETYPVAMQAGIRIHNNIMRRQLRQVGGYEVKTEGDAFMVSFPSATSALLWCFNVQCSLLEQEWPDEILESENGREIQDSEGRVIYKGLSVRMGIHWGAPVCEPDPITGRMDYFGPIVNRASRISAVADGGQISVSSDFVAEINRCEKAYEAYKQAEPSTHAAEEIFGDTDTARDIIKQLKDLKNKGFETKELGERKLKGLENPEFVYLMYPRQLAGRFASKSAQKAIAQPKLSVNPDEIWKLWDLSLRLEMLCSSLNTDSVPILKTHSEDIVQKLRDATGESASDSLMVPLLEHIVTRIENCMSVLYLRRLLAPNPYSTTSDIAAPLVGLIDILEQRLGVRVNEATATGVHIKGLTGTGFIEEISSTNSIASTSSSTAVSPTTATRSDASRNSYMLNLGSSEPPPEADAEL